MQQIDLDSWEEFENKIAELADKKNAYRETPQGGFSGYLFRGQNDSEWKLKPP